MANHMELQDQQFLCPTFTSYSDDRSAETAARVTATSAYLEDDDLNFEFDLVQTDLSLDDVALPGSCHVFPVFNRDHSQEGDGIRVPLKNLFISDRFHVEGQDSPTSSDGEEMYCVWKPKKLPEEAESGRCKKSNSTGSGSKHWKLMDLLKRSNSEGKGEMVFLTPKRKERRTSNDAVKAKVSAVEEFYVRNRATTEGQKRKSYLPYKKDLVGFFVNVKGLGKF